MRLYIDPGTGSMLFTVLIGVISVAVYALRGVWMKLRFYLSGGRAEKLSTDQAPIVIFSDSKRYWNVFEPICDEFERRGQPLEYMTSSPDDPALGKEYQHIKCTFIGEGNKAFARLNTLRTEIVLSTTPSLDVFYWKRSKYVKWYVHIPHSAGNMTLYRMFGIDYYDAILISGEYQTNQIRSLERIRGLPEKELTLAGLTYFDSMKARLDEADHIPEHPTTVLLAPSWGKNAILSVFGGDAIKALLDTGYHIIVRPHPQSYTAEKDLLDSIMQQYPESEQLEWNRDNDNFEVLRRSDILISDFSGVVMDFAMVFDKPIIYANTDFDKSPYDASWLDEEPWTFRILPQLGPKLTKDNLQNIRGLIDGCLNDPEYKEGRTAVRREAWSYPGESAVRTADYLIRKLEEFNEEKDILKEKTHPANKLTIRS